MISILIWGDLGGYGGLCPPILSLSLIYMSNFQPLSNKDITKALAKHGIDVNFVLYSELKHIDSLREIMPCILLYELHYPVGHWVCVFVNREGIQYFDPTGHVPDSLLETNFDHPAGRVKMSADFTYLNQLLLNLVNQTGQPMIYNDFPVQTKNSNTCGAWCFLRLLCQNMTCNEFIDSFKHLNGSKRQEVVAKMWTKLS